MNHLKLDMHMKREHMMFPIEIHVILLNRQTGEMTDHPMWMEWSGPLTEDEQGSAFHSAWGGLLPGTKSFRTRQMSLLRQAYGNVDAVAYWIRTYNPEMEQCDRDGCGAYALNFLTSNQDEIDEFAAFDLMSNAIRGKAYLTTQQIARMMP